MVAGPELSVTVRQLPACSHEDCECPRYTGRKRTRLVDGELQVYLTKCKKCRHPAIDHYPYQDFK